MNTQVLEKPIEINGDKYWESTFSTDESIKRVHLFESKNLDAQIKCGLELWRTRPNLKYTTWYPYLLKCGISQQTANNRMNRAKKFLIWAGILPEKEKKPTEEHVRQGLEATLKSQNFCDFRQHLVEINHDSIVNSLQEATKDVLHEKQSLPIFDVEKILSSIRSVMENHHTWTQWERREVTDRLNIIIENCQQCITAMQAWRELHGMSPDETPTLNSVEQEGEQNEKR